MRLPWPTLALAGCTLIADRMIALPFTAVLVMLAWAVTCVITDTGVVWSAWLRDRFDSRGWTSYYWHGRCRIKEKD